VYLGRPTSLLPPRGRRELIFALERAAERNDVTLNAASVGSDGRRFLRSSSFPEDEASLEVGEMAGTQLLHGDRLVIELAIFDGIITPSDPAELHPCLSACSLWCPGSVKPNCVSTRPPSRSILDDVAALSGTKNPESKAQARVTCKGSGMRRARVDPPLAQENEAAGQRRGMGAEQLLDLRDETGGGQTCKTFFDP
jgi:hypothetical protein